MLVSAIVPVYNKIYVLERCVNSIVNQTYKNIEIVLVDDGSTDGSGVYCDDLKKTDNRISVIHKDNGGVVSARKAGLQQAMGEYILFVDADDWIDNNMVKELLELAYDNNADVVTSGWIIHTSKDVKEKGDNIIPGIYKTLKEKMKLGNRVYFQSDGFQSMNDSLNTKLYEKGLIEKMLFAFPDGVAYTEDSFVAIACIMNAETVYVSDKCFYHYMTQDSTANNSKNHYLLRDLNEGYIYAENLLPQNKLHDIYKKQIERILINFLFLGMNKFMNISDEHCFIRYFFPENVIPENSRIAIYGAGVVGQSYYKQLRKTYEIVYWMDKNQCGKELVGRKIDTPAKDMVEKVDYVLIAIKDEKIAVDVKKNLIGQFQWNELKVLWQEPISVIDKIIDAF